MLSITILFVLLIVIAIQIEYNCGYQTSSQPDTDQDVQLSGPIRSEQGELSANERAGLVWSRYQRPEHR